MNSTTCAQFDDSAAEFALGLLDTADETPLHDHIADCPRCRAELDTLVSTADRLTILAPHAEPPLGFDERAVAGMLAGPAATVATVADLTTRSMNRRRTVTMAVAAAAAVLLLVGGAMLIGAERGSTDRPVAAASLTTASGQSVGAVVLARHGDGAATLTMTLAGVAPGRYHCRVVTPDGRSVDVASWPVASRGSDVWSVELDGGTVEATAVTVTDDDGAEIATASLR